MRPIFQQGGAPGFPLTFKRGHEEGEDNGSGEKENCRLLGKAGTEKATCGKNGCNRALRATNRQPGGHENKKACQKICSGGNPDYRLSIDWMDGKKHCRKKRRHRGSRSQQCVYSAGNGEHQKGIAQVQKDTGQVHEALMEAPYIFVNKE
jgi:hypothetical protein